jgi:hypothetical protein
MTSHAPAAVSPSPDQHTPTSSPPVHTTPPSEQDKPSPAPVNPTPKFVQHISDEPSSTPAKASPNSSPTNTGSGDGGGGWVVGGMYVLPCPFLWIADFRLSGTFFYQNGKAGACGIVHQDSDHVVAIGGCFSDANSPHIHPSQRFSTVLG